MTYIYKEELPARQVNNRVIPPLTKCYRSDGSFDLFNMKYAPFNISWLCNKGYAGFRRIRCNGVLNTDCSFGEYQNAGVGYTDTLNTLGVEDTGSGGNYSGRAVTAVLKLKLDNPMGLTPVYLYAHNDRQGDDDNAGRCELHAYTFTGQDVVGQSVGNYGTVTYDVRSSFPPDYKDINYFWVGAGSKGGGKFAYCYVRSQYIFVTRYSYNKDLYGLYK